MPEDPAFRSALRVAIDQNLHEGLRLATGVLAALLAFFAVADLFIVLVPSYAPTAALLDGATAVGLLWLYLALRRGRIPAAWSHAIAAAIAGTISLTTLYDAYRTADPIQTAYLMLVVLGAGSIFLHLRWLYVVVAGTFLGWLAVAATHMSVAWQTFGFALFAACVMSVLVHTVRFNTFQHMEALRLAEASRKEELQLREVALESAIGALRESEERYRRLVEDAPDAFLVHSEGRILYANTAAVRLLGARNAADLQGREMLALVHPDDRARAKERDAQIEREGRASEPAEMRCVRLDGEVIDVEAQGQPIQYLGRAANQAVFHDITDRKRADAERAVASARLAEISRLKEMDRVKTQFVNTISHELRTPLTPIKVQLHILKGAKDASQVHKATEMLERNVTRLSSLVDELLEVARIQAGTLKLARSYVDLGEVVATSVESYVDVARQHGLELAAEIERGLVVLGDERRLQQVMYNLLGNALKFTTKGDRVVVEVRREGDQALVLVRDTGAGMEPEDVGRLFEAFSQVHDTMEKTNAGTGLGLYISRGIVEGHDGRIWAVSTGKGKGSTFAFALPLADAPSG